MSECAKKIYRLVDLDARLPLRLRYNTTTGGFYEIVARYRICEAARGEAIFSSAVRKTRLAEGRTRLVWPQAFLGERNRPLPADLAE